MSAIEVELKSFSIGTCFQKTFRVFGQAFVPIFIIAAIMHVPILLFGLAVSQMQNAGPSLVAVSGGIGILNAILQIITQGIVVFGTFRVLQGKSFDLSTSFSQAVRRAPTLFGLSFVLVLLVALAFLALIIPGLIVTTMYIVAGPACIVEGIGISDSLKRSQTLTKGYRWQVFGIYALLMVVVSAVSVGSGAFFALAVGPGLVVSILPIVQFLARVIASGLQSVIVGVIYSELRYAKEGVGIDEIVDVFA